MKIPQKILKLMELAGREGDRPLDRLERGKPIGKGREAVAGLSEKELGKLQNPDSLLSAQGALYLYFDCIEEAHQIAQDHEGLLGNWLHAILHRREPDAGNSKYWYARVKLPGKASQEIAGEAVKLLKANPSPELETFRQKLFKSASWDPASFVDLCEKTRREKTTAPGYQTLAWIQEAEWRGLLKTILA
jgi:hypothetical protein